MTTYYVTRNAGTLTTKKVEAGCTAHAIDVAFPNNAGAKEVYRSQHAVIYVSENNVLYTVETAQYNTFIVCEPDPAMYAVTHCPVKPMGYSEAIREISAMYSAYNAQGYRLFIQSTTGERVRVY